MDTAIWRINHANTARDCENLACSVFSRHVPYLCDKKKDASAAGGVKKLTLMGSGLVKGCVRLESINFCRRAKRMNTGKGNLENSNGAAVLYQVIVKGGHISFSPLEMFWNGVIDIICIHI